MTDKEELDKIIETVSEQEQEYAQNALNEFKKRNYIGALQCLNKLDGRTNDFKVMHNKALVEYCKSDFKKNDNFMKSLTTFCNQFKLRVETVDDIDQCILHYNQAILLYHQKQYESAIQIMDRVYKFIEPMDDTLSKQVSLFIIELQLCVRQPEKALSLIGYVENQLLNGTPNIKLLDRSKEKDKKSQLPPDSATEEFKMKLLKHKIRCYLMKHSLDAAVRELQVLAKEKSNVNTMFLVANLEYLKGNFVEAQRILTSIPNDCLLYSEYGESSTIMFYNNMGILHHAMGKPHMACHYFQLALKKDIPLSNISKKDLNEKQLHTLGGSKYHELMHNLGVALLYARRPMQAFECLVVAVRRYHRNSRLWMRLAECCIMVNKESNESDFDFQKKQKDIVVGVIGYKDKRKVMLNTKLSKDKKYSSESISYAVPTPTLEFASLCLRNAHLLLPSDVAPSPVPHFMFPTGQYRTTPVPTSTLGPAPSSPLTTDGLVNLRNSILASSSYVALCLGDYILALEHAENLLKQPRISEAHKFLGHLYCAEALVLLDKISEALDHLNPENITDITFELPHADTFAREQNEESRIRTSPSTRWFPANSASTRATIQYNIAVAKTIKGQLSEAFAILKQLWTMSSTCKVPGHILMLVLYIELRMGHPDSARSLIKQYMLQRTT